MGAHRVGLSFLRGMIKFLPGHLPGLYHRHVIRGSDAVGCHELLASRTASVFCGVLTPAIDTIAFGGGASWCSMPWLAARGADSLFCSAVSDYVPENLALVASPGLRREGPEDILPFVDTQGIRERGRGDGYVHSFGECSAV